MSALVSNGFGRPSHMFTTNEREVLKQLKHGGTSTLGKLTKTTGLARSSTYQALKKLLELGVVTTVGNDKHGPATYRLESPAALERAAQVMLSDFRDAINAIRPRERWKIAFTDLYVLPDTLLQRLRTRFDVVTYDDANLFASNESFLRRSQDADVVVRFDAATVDAAYLRACPRLKVIVCATADLLNVDLDACSAAGVKVLKLDTIAQKYFAPTQVEYVVHTLLNLHRSMQRSAQDVPFADLYRDKTSLGTELFGTRVGLLFTDSDITQLVRVLQALGCEVAAAPTHANPPRAAVSGLASYESVERLWHWADSFVVLENVELNIDDLLTKSRIPQYIVVCSDTLKYNPDVLREQVIRERVLGLALDFLPGQFATNIANEDPQLAMRALVNLPNVLITPELSVLSTDSFARNFEYVFEMLMDLDTTTEVE
jgi:phosphoglycerate dehydrogenase-like enzyme/predicted transcriptional regulator